MRFCGTFCSREQLGGPKQRPQADPFGLVRRPRPLPCPARRPPFRLVNGLPQGLDRSDAAPPEVTTSSTRHTSSPSAATPSSRLAVPYSFVSLRTIRKGRPDSSEAAAARATAPSSGPAIRYASGSCSRDRLGEPIAERPEQVGPGLEAVLVEVVARTAPGAEDEIALEVGVLAERGPELVAVHLGAGGREQLARERRAGARPRASPRSARPSSRRRSRAGRAPAGARLGAGENRARPRSRPRAGSRSGSYDPASLFFFDAAACGPRASVSPAPGPGRGERS